MTKDELKHSVIYQVLKSDKKLKESLPKFAKTQEWTDLKLFVAEVKQKLLESTLEVDNIDEVKKYKFLIRGMESIVLLPELLGDIKNLESQEKLEKEEAEKEAKRKKYNPGAFVRRVIGRR